MSLSPRVQVPNQVLAGFKTHLRCAVSGVCVCVCVCSVVSYSLRPMDCSPPGSSVHGISQARILEWVTIPFSRVLPNPGIAPVSPPSPALAGKFLPLCHLESPCGLRLFSHSVMSNFATPWLQHARLPSFTMSLSLLKLMSIESVMPSNHLILCRPLLLLPSIFPSIGVFSNKSALCTRMPPCHQVAKLWSREQHVILTQDGPVESPGGGKTTDPGKQAVACSWTSVLAATGSPCLCNLLSLEWICVALAQVVSSFWTEVLHECVCLGWPLSHAGA